MTLLAAGAGDNTDWKALFCGLIDKTISGDVVIPNTVETTEIPQYIFENCASLTSLVLPAKITTIGTNAFNKCGNITSITKSDGSGISVVNGRSFADCKKLVEIPPFAEGMTAVQNWCFIGCTALTHIELPSTINMIKGQAFYGCRNLNYIVLKATNPPTLQSGAIPNQLVSLYVPDASVDTYKTTSGWSDIASKIKPMSELTNS